MENNNILLYKSADGKIMFQVKTDGETVWLSQKQMAELFDCSVDNISLHLRNVFKSNELSQISVTEDFSATAADGKIYKTRHYNLDAIISVGYRVNSIRGTAFRIWATQRLREFIIKGFALDDERMKQGRASTKYFEELIERIRDIRSSERNFYQKITDIYSTSIDYSCDDAKTRDFFATVQNKLHYAVHGHTAAELIAVRADAAKPFMGLTGFKGNFLTQADTHVAKNYLTEPELKQLNLIVSMFLDFAELQASNCRAMKMGDWLEKFDGYLKLAERDILAGPGKISGDLAGKKADEEFFAYRKMRDAAKISDFDTEAKELLNLLKEQGQK